MAPAYAGLCGGVGRGRRRVDRWPNHADDTSESGDRLASLCPGSPTDPWVAVRARRPRAGLPVLSEAPGPGDTRLPDLRADAGGPVSAGARSERVALTAVGPPAGPCLRADRRSPLRSPRQGVALAIRQPQHRRPGR